ncbi:MAG: hypothetical protein JWO36_1731 [Myxococcales bacterium]|nr:hypothetical protein [Myxococcales bacterium]
MPMDSDMTMPVTRGELREELDSFKTDVGAAIHRFESRTLERFTAVEHKSEVLGERVSRVETRLTGLEDKVSALDHKVTALDDKVTGLDHKVTALDHKVTGLDHKVTALDHKVTALDHKVTALDHKVDGLAQQVTGLSQQVADLPKQLSAELAQHVHVIGEQFRAQISVVDEKYQDLPRRVDKLETAVSAPKRKRR